MDELTFVGDFNAILEGTVASFAITAETHVVAFTIEAENLKAIARKYPVSGRSEASGAGVAR